MRLSYILVVVIAVTLQACVCAIPVIKEANQAMLANGPLPSIVNTEGGRLLRGVKKRTAESEVQEERMSGAKLSEKGKQFLKWFFRGSDTRVKGRSWR
ncbi:hypothetical protein PInf_004936 [Phytophthora infestans]|nr:hypothetical protein PInf_004936 [Phytophthora infestans]